MIISHICAVRLQFFVEHYVVTQRWHSVQYSVGFKTGSTDPFNEWLYETIPALPT